MGSAVREETHEAVRRLTLCRPDEYNTITPSLRDELSAMLDSAQRDRDIRVILLDAEGPAFCAGYGLDWSTSAQAGESESARAGVGFRGRPAHDRLVRLRVGEAARLVEADSGGCVGLVHRRRHEHRVQRPPHRRRRVGPLRLSAITRVGRPEAPWTWVARMGLQTGAAVHAHRRRVRRPPGARDGGRARRRTRRRVARATRWRLPSGSPSCPPRNWR